MLHLLHRLAIVFAATQVAADVVGLAALAMPMDPAAKWWVLIGVLAYTAIADVGLLAYLLWVPPTPAVAPAGGAMPGHHMSRGSIKAGLYMSTLALITTILAIMILVTGVAGYWGTLGFLFAILLVITIQDIAASVAVLRR